MKGGAFGQDQQEHDVVTFLRPIGSCVESRNCNSDKGNEYNGGGPALDRGPYLLPKQNKLSVPSHSQHSYRNLPLTKAKEKPESQ